MHDGACSKPSDLHQKFITPSPARNDLNITNSKCDFLVSISQIIFLIDKITKIIEPV